MIVRLIGFPTRETNSSHASSSQGPAQRQTMSFRDKDEYRVGLGVFDIVLCMFPVVAEIAYRKQCYENEDGSHLCILQMSLRPSCESPSLLRPQSDHTHQAGADRLGFMSIVDVFVALTGHNSF